MAISIGWNLGGKVHPERYFCVRAEVQCWSAQTFMLVLFGGVNVNPVQTLVPSRSWKKV